VPHRLLLVDDDPAIRQMLADLIEMQGDFSVVASVPDAAQAMEVLERETPDIVLADLLLGSGPDGIQLTTGIKVANPLLPVLVLSAHGDETVFADRALLAGAAGYVRRENSTDNIFEALAAAIRGGIWLSPTMRELLLPPSITPSGAIEEGLKDADLVLIRELRAGNRSVVGLSRRLHQPPASIERKLGQLQQRLGLPSRAALYLYVG
jgi:DNA-binding NarL/FixJ family response regulator